MDSQQWREKRLERLGIDGYRCFICGTESSILQVHHIHYNSFKNEDASKDLVTLCKRCHENIHNAQDSIRELDLIFNIGNRARIFSRILIEVWSCFFGTNYETTLAVRHSNNEELFSKLVGKASYLTRYSEGFIKRKESGYAADINIANKSTDILTVTFSYKLALTIVSDMCKYLKSNGFSYDEIAIWFNQPVAFAEKFCGDQIPTIHTSSTNTAREYYIAYLFKEFESMLGEKGKTLRDILGEKKILITKGYVMPHPKLIRVTNQGGGEFHHPAGGFVLKITDATDYENDGYMDIGYEIAEGEYAGRYEYSNGFRRYYKSNFDGATAFDKFMTSLEDSNPGFDMMTWQTTWNPDALVGLVVGAVFQERMYTSNSGEDRKMPRLYYCCNAQSIRDGNYRVPEPKDDRVKVDDAPAADIYTDNGGAYGDFPF